MVKAYQTARAWADVDPEAARAEQRIVQELRDRHGVDAGTDAGSVREAIDRAERERGKGHGDEQEAAALMLAAGEADRRAEEAAERAELAAAAGSSEGVAEADTERARQAGTAEGVEADGAAVYDSADRRGQLAQHLEETVDNKTAVQARVRADTSQAKPATDATRRTSTTSPTARRSRTTAAGRQAQRGGQAR